MRSADVNRFTLLDWQIDARVAFLEEAGFTERLDRLQTRRKRGLNPLCIRPDLCFPAPVISLLTSRLTLLLVRS